MIPYEKLSLLKNKASYFWWSKSVSILIKNSQKLFFGRYDETRAKLNTVYRLTVYGGNSFYWFWIWQKRIKTDFLH